MQPVPGLLVHQYHLREGSVMRSGDPEVKRQAWLQARKEWIDAGNI